jgi:hypothetical protein
MAKRWGYALIDGFPRNETEGRLSDFRGLLRRINDEMVKAERALDEMVEINVIHYLASKEERDKAFGHAFERALQDTTILARLEWRYSPDALSNAVQAAEQGVEYDLDGLLRMAVIRRNDETEISDPVNQQKTLLDSMVNLAHELAVNGAYQTCMEDYLEKQKGEVSTQLSGTRLCASAGGSIERRYLVGDDMLVPFASSIQHSEIWPSGWRSFFGISALTARWSIPVTDSASYRESEEGLPHRINSNVYPEEQVASILKGYYEVQFNEICEDFTPRFRYLLRFVRRLEHFIFLLMSDCVREEFSEGARFLAIDIAGRSYRLTKAAEEYDYSAAMRRYVTLGTDAEDLKKAIPLAEGNVADYLAGETDGSAFSRLADPAIEADFRKLLRILNACGGHLPLGMDLAPVGK